MGRGRAKAKQAKVARELKYYSPQTDLAALERELAGDRGTGRDIHELRGGRLDDDDCDSRIDGPAA